MTRFVIRLALAPFAYIAIVAGSIIVALPIVAFVATWNLLTTTLAS